MKKIRKWLGFCILTMLTVLAGITVFADGKLPGGKAYGTYFPNATIQKVWEDKDNALGNRPEELTVNVACLDYYNIKHMESVTLSAENNWTHRFPGEWKVTYDSEQGLTDDYGFKSYEVIEQGDNYLLKVTNGLRYPVNYAWTWEDENGLYQEQSDGYAGQYLPYEEKYVAGTEVEVSSTHYVGRQATQDGIKYVFEGWDRQGEFIMPEEAVTISGKWKRAAQHKVSYEWEGLPGDAVKPPDSKLYYEYEYVSVDSSYRAGTYIKVDNDTYRFSGWSTDWEGLGNSSSFRMPDHDVLFKGKWEQVPAYTLNYEWKWDHGDGTLSDQAPAAGYWRLPSSGTYAEGDEVSRDWYNKGYDYGIGYGNDRQVYVFSGWKEVSYVDDLDGFYDAEEAKKEFLMPAKDMTLYGVWKKMPTFTVKYEWTFEGLTKPPSSPYLAQPNNPFYAGQMVSVRNTNYQNGSTTIVNGTKYQFSGWTAYKEGNDKDSLEYDNKEDFIMPKHNIVFKGVWKKVDSYTVEYQWDGLPEPNSKDKDGYTVYSVLTVPEDRKSPYIKDETVYKDMTGDQYVQTAESIDMNKAYKIDWSKYDYDTHKYAYKYTYYYFSGWTAYDKQEYTADKNNATPLKLSIGADGTFKMPKQNILFVGHWTEINTAPYTVTWYKIANKNAGPDTAQLIARRPNPDTRVGKVNETVSVTERDMEDINEYGMYMFVEDYPHNVKKGTVLADGSLELKLYFAPETGDLKVSKTVAGNDGEKNREFEFKVTLTDVNHQPVKGTFNDLTFDDNGQATFKLTDKEERKITGIPTGTNYKVEEIGADKDGYLIDYANETGTITKRNTAEVTVTNTRSKVEVTSTDLGINGIKTLDGREFKEGDQFKFYIRDSANAPKDQPTPSKTECVIKPTSGNTAKIDFDSTFTFTKPGKYIYIISEYQPQHDGTEIIPGVTYDTTAYRLTVETELEEKELKISKITIESSPREAVGQWTTLYEGDTLPKKQYCAFNNTYKSLEQSVALTGTKILNNKYLADYGKEQFKFIVEAVGRKEADGSYQKDPNQPMPRGTVGGVLTVQNLVTGGVVLPGNTFTREHAGREYRYTITEYQPTDSGRHDGNPLEGAVMNGDNKWVYKGVIFDNHVHTVDVKAEIVQNADGSEELKVAISHDEHGTGEGAMQNFVFTNTYDASTKMQLTGTKKLTGREFIQGDEFKFNITPVGSAPALIDSEGNAISSVVIDPAGDTEEEIDFGTCNFTAADLNHEEEKIFEYKITEEKGTDKHIIYDTKERIVQIKVTDDGVGNMKAEVVSDSKNLIWNNRYPNGGLTVTKEVTGTHGDKEKKFHFTVTLSDSAISGTYGDMEFADGVAEITLKHGDSATAEGLPAGIGYTVAEDDYSGDGYVTTQEGAEGTIPEDETVTASFTNTKEVTPPEPKLGDLKVSKTVEGNAGEKEKAFHFTITLSDSAINGTYGDMEFTDGVAEIMLKHGESATAEGLLAGIGYTVAEDDYSEDGYVTTQEGAEGTIPEDETVTASFTNTKEVTPPEPKLGDLKVSKTVEGNAGEKEKAFHFTVTLSDSAINGTYGDMEFTDGVAEITLKHGDSATAEGLPAGIGYTVAEDDYSGDGYVTTQEGAEGTIPEGETITASFTNTKEVTPPEPKRGDLKVSKTVEGNAGDKNKDFHFTVKLEDETISGVYGDIEFTDGVAEIMLKHGESATAEGLPAGAAYEVTETEADQDGYVTTSKGAKGTLEEGETVTASFTNTKEEVPPEVKLGNLKVGKTVEGNAGDKNKDFHFTVKLEDETISGTYGDMEFTDGVAEFALKHDEWKTATKLPTGIGYTVAEDDYSGDGYVTTQEGAEGTIPEGETITASFTNTKEVTPKLGDLKVSKTVEGNAGEKEKAFHFTITLSDSAINGTYGDMEFTDGVAEIMLKHGESATAEGLPAGIGYTVAEDDYSGDGYVTTQEGAEGTIPEGETITASFTNTKEVTPKLGDLKVSKTVEGNAGEKEKAFHFTITLSDSAINGTYGDMEFTDGVAEIMLKHGESATAEGLLAGIGYTVAEDDYSGDGYVTTQEGAEGTISEDETAEASFTNTKEVTPPEPKRGDLKVSKTVEGNAGDKEKAFHFTVTLSDSAVNGTYGDMEFTDGVAEIMLKHGESATAEGIPAGIGYMIAEDDYSEDGYVTTQEGAEGTIPEDETATASFTNTKEVTPPEQPQKPDEDTPRPETGDSTSMGLYLSLLILSGLTCTILGVFKKKNYKNR